MCCCLLNYFLQNIGYKSCIEDKYWNLLVWPNRKKNSWYMCTSVVHFLCCLITRFTDNGFVWIFCTLLRMIVSLDSDEFYLLVHGTLFSKVTTSHVVPFKRWSFIFRKTFAILASQYLRAVYIHVLYKYSCFFFLGLFIYTNIHSMALCFANFYLEQICYVENYRKKHGFVLSEKLPVIVI